MSLSHFTLTFDFYTPWKFQKTSIEIERVKYVKGSMNLHDEFTWYVTFSDSPASIINFETDQLPRRDIQGEKKGGHNIEKHWQLPSDFLLPAVSIYCFYFVV